MKFMINFTHIDGAWEKLSPSELENIQAQHKEFVRVLREEQKTQMTFFTPSGDAKIVRRTQDWNLEVSDGPLLPGPEFVGGYFIMQADSMDDAVEFAKRGRYMFGANVIRELVESE